MNTSVEVVFWCNDLTELLQARCLIQRDHSHATALVVGPVGTPAVFEMDAQSVLWVELPPWVQGAKPGWMTQRKLAQWLNSWLPDTQVKQITFMSSVPELLSIGLSRLGVQGKVLECLADDFQPSCLMAGPSSLSISTQRYRSASPNGMKLLVVIDFEDMREQSLPQLIADIQGALPEQRALASHLKLELQLTFLAFGSVSKLQRRELAQHHPEWKMAGIGSLIGHLAYADKVMGRGKVLTLLCHQMNKQKPVLL